MKDLPGRRGSYKNGGTNILRFAQTPKTITAHQIKTMKPGNQKNVDVCTVIVVLTEDDDDTIRVAFRKKEQLYCHHIQLAQVEDMNEA